VPLLAGLAALRPNDAVQTVSPDWREAARGE
jgi:hypothetical protein